MLKIKKVNMPRVGFFWYKHANFSSLEAKLEIGFVYSIHPHKDIDAYMKQACYGMMC